jgi:hypothetical protein
MQSKANLGFRHPKMRDGCAVLLPACAMAARELALGDSDRLLPISDRCRQKLVRPLYHPVVRFTGNFGIRTHFTVEALIRRLGWKATVKTKLS